MSKIYDGITSLLGTSKEAGLFADVVVLLNSEPEIWLDNEGLTWYMHPKSGLSIMYVKKFDCFWNAYMSVKYAGGYFPEGVESDHLPPSVFWGDTPSDVRRKLNLDPVSERKENFHRYDLWKECFEIGHLTLTMSFRGEQRNGRLDSISMTHKPTNDLINRIGL